MFRTLSLKAAVSLLALAATAIRPMSRGFHTTAPAPHATGRKSPALQKTPVPFAAALAGPAIRTGPPDRPAQLATHHCLLTTSTQSWSSGVSARSSSPSTRPSWILSPVRGLNHDAAQPVGTCLASSASSQPAGV